MSLSAKKLFSKGRHFFKYLWDQNGSPAYRARGLAIGVFSGCFPLFGLQTFIGISLAGLFKGNTLLAAMGTWISNPFTYLPLYWFNYHVGSFFLGEVTHIDQYKISSFRSLFGYGTLFLQRLFIGSLVCGVFLSFVCGLLTYFTLLLYKKNNIT